MLNEVATRHALGWRDVMNWTSDRTWIAAEAALFSLAVLLWIYIPA